MTGLDLALALAVVLGAGSYLAWVLLGSRGDVRQAKRKPKTDDDCCGPT
jgi:hypothetical protein